VHCMVVLVKDGCIYQPSISINRAVSRLHLVEGISTLQTEPGSRFNVDLTCGDSLLLLNQTHPSHAAIFKVNFNSNTIYIYIYRYMHAYMWCSIYAHTYVEPGHVSFQLGLTVFVSCETSVSEWTSNVNVRERFSWNMDG